MSRRSFSPNVGSVAFIGLFFPYGEILCIKSCYKQSGWTLLIFLSSPPALTYCLSSFPLSLLIASSAF